MIYIVKILDNGRQLDVQNFKCKHCRSLIQKPKELPAMNGFIDLNNYNYILKENDRIVLLYTGCRMPGLEGGYRIEETLVKNVMMDSCATFWKTSEGFMRYSPIVMQDYVNLIIYTVKKYSIGDLSNG